MDSDLFHVSQSGSTTVVELILPHTMESSEFDRLNESLLQLVAQRTGGSWVLDLSHLSYMGSSVLGLMVNIRQRVKQGGGRLFLCGLSPRLLQIFRTCCLERLFSLNHTRAEALKLAQG